MNLDAIKQTATSFLEKQAEAIKKQAIDIVSHEMKQKLNSSGMPSFNKDKDLSQDPPDSVIAINEINEKKKQADDIKKKLDAASEIFSIASGIDTSTVLGILAGINKLNSLKSGGNKDISDYKIDIIDKIKTILNKEKDKVIIKTKQQIK